MRTADKLSLADHFAHIRLVRAPRFEVRIGDSRIRTVLVQDQGTHWTFLAEGDPLPIESQSLYDLRSRRARLPRREVVRLVESHVGFPVRWDSLGDFELLERSAERIIHQPTTLPFIDGWDGTVPESLPGRRRPQTPALARLVRYIDTVQKDARAATLVPFRVFLDGNTEPGSVGADCSLKVFGETLSRLEGHPRVGAVLVELHEYDPHSAAWPQTEKLVVVGHPDSAEIEALLEPLAPDDISNGDVPGLTTVWWD